jgi:hypothetical protein
MSDSFGAFLQGFNPRDRELQNPLSPARLILAAVLNAPQTDAALKEDVGLGDDAFRAALQLLADEGLVTARPQKGGLLIDATPRGRTLAAG